MTKLQNFFENPFNATFNGLKKAATNEANKRTVNAANEVFKDKPYHVENKTTYSISKTISMVANAVSFATGFFALQAVLSLVVGYWIATGGAMALCGLLEWLKNNRWKVTVKQLLRYKNKSLAGFGVLAALSIISIGASGYGAYILPTQIAHPAPVAYSKNDSLLLGELAAINAQIANLDKLQLETSQKAIPNAQGKISGSIKELQLQQSKQKQALNEQKTALSSKINDLHTQHAQSTEKALIEHKNGLLWQQIACLVVAVLFELIYIGCSCYCFYYLFRVFVDNENPTTNQTDQPNDLQTVIPNDQTEPHQHTPTNQTTKRKIGFFSDQPNDQTADKYTTTNPNLTDNQTDQTNQPNGFTTVLKPFADGLVSEENGIKFVYHNGKKYTKADVQNNVWAFRSKVKNYEQTDLTKAAKYKQHLVRWETYLISIS